MAHIVQGMGVEETGTRGIIFVRRMYDSDDCVCFVYEGVYSDYNSHPTWLGWKIYEAMRGRGIDGVEDFKREILSGRFSDGTEIRGLEPKHIDHALHKWIYVIEDTGFEVWKSSHRERRLYYCGWVSIFDEPEEARLRLLIAEMLGDAMEKITMRELPARL